MSGSGNGLRPGIQGLRSRRSLFLPVFFNASLFKSFAIIIPNLENNIELSFSFRRIHTFNFSGGIVISVQPFSKFLSFLIPVPSNRK